MAELLSERYLAVRAHDHVVFGVQWWDAEPVAAAGPAQVRVGPDGGGLLITFPPQQSIGADPAAASSPFGDLSRRTVFADHIELD
jgi:hypothetical protein